jgi:hypothetical protein
LSALARDRTRLDGMRSSAHQRAQRYSWRHAATLNLAAFEDALRHRQGAR